MKKNRLTSNSISLKEHYSIIKHLLRWIDLSICVELIDEKHKLEAFCQKHAELLKGKMIVFKAVEFWEIK